MFQPIDRGSSGLAPGFAIERLEQRMLFATLPAGFVEEAVAGTLSGATAMEFAPDGRLFVAQEGGQLRVIHGTTLNATPFLTVTTDTASERGLLGIAFDPNFATNRFLYVYYTVPAPTGGLAHNRVSRFTASAANPDLVEAGSEVAILDLEDLNAGNHNGGAIHFGVDGKLYVAVGENAVASNARLLTNKLGKILRINPDGTRPTDNPYFTNDGVTQAADYIWALGLRNPYTFAIQPGTGLIYINDVGESTWEEINVGVAGANYGWGNNVGGNIEGFRTTQTAPANYRDPLHAYRHPLGGDATTTGIAISGGAFYNPSTPNFPIEFVGDYFFADVGGSASGNPGGNWIRKLEAGTGTSTLFATGLSSPVDLKTGPDGKLYWLERGNGGRVRRIAATTPAVSSIVLNDGNVQRSKINSITVNLTRAATFDAGAFAVVGRNGAGAGITVGVTPSTGSATSFVLSFSGTGVIGGSLPDGIYDLTVDAAKVHDLAVPAMTLAANSTLALHRLYSDIDGDGDSDNADLFQMRSTYNKFTGDAGFNASFDYDGDGDVDNADVFQVRSRRVIVFQGY